MSCRVISDRGHFTGIRGAFALTDCASSMRSDDREQGKVQGQLRYRRVASYECIHFNGFILSVSRLSGSGGFQHSPSLSFFASSK